MRRRSNFIYPHIDPATRLRMAWASITRAHFLGQEAVTFASCEELVEVEG